MPTIKTQTGFFNFSKALQHDNQYIQNKKDLIIIVGQLLGRAGTSGWTKDIIQLHLEIHLKNITSNETVKIDPYGVNNRASSNRYPQPGSSLAGLPHLWTSNTPPFAS